MATERMHLIDASLLQFDATIVARTIHADRAAVVLDRTAFYAESGGQLADRGRLGELDVLDVQVDDRGNVHHVISSEPPAVGTSVHGTVEPTRRKLHMALHTGQHMLSRALLDVAKAETVSSRLGEGDCTIDIDVASVPDPVLVRAQDLVQAIIDDDVAVRSFFPSVDELAELALRRAPQVDGDVRVVQIEGFDVSPCGGTHCARTSQVGTIRITGTERYKGKLRIHFSAGRRARNDLFRTADLVDTLAKSFTCGAEDLPSAVEALRRDLRDLRESQAATVEQLASLVAAREHVDAREAGVTRIVVRLSHGGRELARHVARRLAVESFEAVVVGVEASGLAIVVARGPTSTLDAGAFLKTLVSQTSGRGGGRSELAEGQSPLDREADVLAIARA